MVGRQHDVHGLLTISYGPHTLAGVLLPRIALLLEGANLGSSPDGDGSKDLTSETLRLLESTNALRKTAVSFGC
jgi:hypothetical protein